MSDKKAPKTAQELYVDLLKEVKAITKHTPEQAELLRMDALYQDKKLKWEDKEFDIYRKAVRAAFRAEKAMKAVKDLDAGKAAKRTNLLCQLGGLVLKAGLDQIDREILAGMISNMVGSYNSTVTDLKTADKAAEAQKRIDGWKSKGKAFLNQGA